MDRLFVFNTNRHMSTKGTMAPATLAHAASKRTFERTSKLSTGKKLLASAAVVGVLAAVAGLGSWGAFTGSTSASQKVATGSAGLEMPYSDFNGPVSGMLPGDTIERTATLYNPGSSSLK